MKIQGKSSRVSNIIRGKRLYKAYKNRDFNISISDGASEKRGLFRIVSTSKEKIIKKKLFSLWQI